MKKLFALLLAVLMLLSLAACNTDKPVETQPKETGNKPVETQGTEPPETQGPPVTVTWLTIATEPEGSEAVLAHLNEMLLERYNLQVKFEWIGTGEYNERTKLASTGGEDYDIVYTTYVWLNRFHENLARGGFYDITDILDEYGPAIKEQLVPTMWDVATVSGRIYAIPNQQASGTGAAFYVQKDLADKYGLDPTKPVSSADDIKWFLEKVRDNEPGMFPIHIPKGLRQSAYENLACAGAVKIRCDDDPADGIEVVWDISGSEMERNYHREGLLHPEYYVSKDLNTIKAANQFAVYSGNNIVGGAVSQSLAQGEEYYQIPFSKSYMNTTAGADTMLAINSNSKDPVAALRLINAFWEDEEIYNTFLFGLEGVHYNKVGENRVELIEGAEWKVYSQDWAHGNQFNRWLMPGEADDVWEKTLEANLTAEISPLRGFSPDLTELQVEITQITAVQGEYKYYYLEDNWEELEEEYKQKLIAAGIETVVKEIQEQVDAFLATK